MIDINELLTKQPILLFDGECGFCNKSVQFFLKREKKKTMHFVPLQSETGAALRKYFEIDDRIDSIILIRDYSAYIKSCAALRLTLYMKGAWPLMAIFLVIPPFLRNPVYSFIAKHRMKLFGRVDSCALIPEEDRIRILDQIG
ncbi:MAG: thiol-disulfide oxidoreductase DCC family protein [Bacteroidia bacterium]